MAKHSSYVNLITLFTINKDHTTKCSSNTQQSLKMNVLTTIKDGDIILRASGRFANDERTVSLNNFTGETWFHLRQHGTGIQKSFSMRASEYLELVRMVDPKDVVALDEGFKRQVSTFNIVYGSKTMLLLSTLVLIYNSYNNITIQYISLF